MFDLETVTTRDGLIVDTLPDFGSATFSPCRRYRYELRRTLAGPLMPRRIVLFIMLNPSTADAMQNDRTIRRCISYALAEGGTELVVVNLFGWRATDPKALRDVADPYGPANAAVMRAAIAEADIIIAGWGDFVLFGHLDAVTIPISLALKAGKDVCALELTMHLRAPRHPLYLSKALRPRVWMASDGSTPTVWGGQ